MKGILNLYNYKVYVDCINRKDVKLIFSISLPNQLYNKCSIDIMNLCVALNKEFNVSKIDIYSYDHTGMRMYIKVNKDIGYKILKTFLDNTSDLEEIKKIDEVFAKISEDVYGKSYFSNYIENYKNGLSNYENAVNKQVILDIFNLYTKRVEWKLDEKERIYITIAPNDCKALHAANDDFNVLDICKELENKFHISKIELINKYNISNIGLTCGDSDAKLAFTIEDVNIGYKILKTFLDNTDESLLDDRYLITDKDNVLRMREIIARYKLMLKEYKSKFCKDDIA